MKDIEVDVFPCTSCNRGVQVPSGLEDVEIELLCGYCGHKHNVLMESESEDTFNDRAKRRRDG